MLVAEVDFLALLSGVATLVTAAGGIILTFRELKNHHQDRVDEHEHRLHQYRPPDPP